MEQEKREEGKKIQFGQKSFAPKNEYYSGRPEMQRKEPSMLKQQFVQGMSLFIVLVSVILLYFLLLRIKSIASAIGTLIDILKPITYGLAIAYLLNPIMKFVESYMMKFLEKYIPDLKKKEKTSRIVGIFVALALLFAVIVALFNMMIPELVQSIKSMIVTLPSQLNRAVDQISEMFKSDTMLGVALTKILEEGTQYLSNWMRTDLMDQLNVLMSNVTVGVFNVFQELFNMLIGICVSVYLLYSKETFSKQCKKIVYAVWKPKKANMLLHMTSKSNGFFGGFIIGKIVDSAIIGVLCFIGLSIIDMPYTLLVSVVVGVTNVIPFFGPYIGAIPSAILILLSDPKMGLYFIIFIIVLQQLDGNVIGPTILGDSTGLSAFWVMFAILVGGGMFGVLGMILGVPTFAMIYYIVKIMIEQRLEDKELPIETDCYDELSYVTNEGVYVHSQKKEVHTLNENTKDHNKEESKGEE